MSDTQIQEWWSSDIYYLKSHFPETSSQNSCDLTFKFSSFRSHLSILFVGQNLLLSHKIKLGSSKALHWWRLTWHLPEGWLLPLRKTILFFVPSQAGNLPAATVKQRCQHLHIPILLDWGGSNEDIPEGVIIWATVPPFPLSHIGLPDFSNLSPTAYWPKGGGDTPS